VMEGDDRFFLSDREIELAWWVIDSVKDTIKKAALTPILYKEKSHGPDESALFFSWYY
jgi:glucose-6-phosphate 1-dehydrogenase